MIFSAEPVEVGSDCNVGASSAQRGPTLLRGLSCDLGTCSV